MGLQLGLEARPGPGTRQLEPEMEGLQGLCTPGPKASAAMRRRARVSPRIASSTASAVPVRIHRVATAAETGEAMPATALSRPATWSAPAASGAAT